MPVAVQNEKASDTSRIWLIVSRVAAAVLGGYVVTYWAGAAVAKMAMEWDLLSRADAGMFSGLYSSSSMSLSSSGCAQWRR